VAVERGGGGFTSYVTALADYDDGRLHGLIEFWDARLQSGRDGFGSTRKTSKQFPQGFQRLEYPQISPVRRQPSAGRVS